MRGQLVHEFEANVEVGDFRIVRRIGAGGMGIVYLARQISLDRDVALKVLGASLTHPGDILRFKREAQAAARLKHPGIATVFYTGQDEHACYMAMEYIDGITLRSVIVRLASTTSKSFAVKTLLQGDTELDVPAPRVRFDDLTEPDTSSFALQSSHPALPAGGLTNEAGRLISGKPYIHWVCEVIRDAALALEHAHRHGVVHRDIKPQNIMVDRNGQVHVIDFGIARFYEDLSLTGTGQLIGTPMYMSPEQVAERLVVDHRSDIYSLGLVMYELLTLRRPWVSPTRDGVLRGVLTKSIVPVSWKNVGISQSIESVVHKATAKDPDERYQSARGFAEDLNRCLQGEAVAADPYRYKFDKGQILASRPWAASVSALWFTYVAVFYGLMWLPNRIGRGIADPTGSEFLTTRFGWSCYVAGFLCLAVAAIVSAILLLSGRAKSLWFAIPVAVVAVGLSLGEPYSIIAGAVLHNNPKYLALKSVDLITHVTLIAGGCCVIPLLLLQRSVRRWFQFCSQVRAEYHELRGGSTQVSDHGQSSPD